MLMLAKFAIISSLNIVY